MRSTYEEKSPREKKPGMRKEICNENYCTRIGKRAREKGLSGHVYGRLRQGKKHGGKRVFASKLYQRLPWWAGRERRGGWQMRCTDNHFLRIQTQARRGEGHSWRENADAS